MARQRANKYRLTVDYERLKADLQIPLDDLPKLFRHYYGVKVCRASVYFWFSKGAIPRDRLIQLLFIASLVHKRVFELWRYVDIYNPHERKAA